MRRVFDEPNAFLPELKRRKKKEDGAGSSTGSSSRFSIPAGSKAIPPDQRIKRCSHAVDAYTRHKMMINNYVAYYKGSTKKLQRDTSNDKNDFDIIRENHRFLWSENELSEAEQSWEARLAKRYYDKLFKEYCIVDLSRYVKNVYAMRWRVEPELFSGKGQFECGSKHCQTRDGLSSWEVNFAYTEHGVKKNALVKVRLCPDCSAKLNFHSQKRLVKKKMKVEVKKEVDDDDDARADEKRRKKEEKRRRRRRREEEEQESSSSSSSSDTETEEAEKKVPEEEKRKIDEAASREQASEIWSKKTAVLDAEKTVNDEFDEFIDDLLL
uniref:Protein FRA10AC1 n=1 Tax=Globodera rostochiensis TaxID=31243 RepID=A0A914HI56_GLORO